MAERMLTLTYDFCFFVLKVFQKVKMKLFCLLLDFGFCLPAYSAVSKLIKNYQTLVSIHSMISLSILYPLLTLRWVATWEWEWAKRWRKVITTMKLTKIQNSGPNSFTTMATTLISFEIRIEIKYFMSQFLEVGYRTDSSWSDSVDHSRFRIPHQRTRQMKSVRNSISHAVLNLLPKLDRWFGPVRTSLTGLNGFALDRAIGLYSGSCKCLSSAQLARCRILIF